MAAKHQLALELPPSNNVKVFRISDISTYAEGLATDCGTLQITPPGFNQPTTIEVLPHFNLVLNGCTLGLQQTNCGTHQNNLPDGIYWIRYSVSPNDKVYVEYNHLRMTQTLNRYYNTLCTLEMAACEPEPDVKEQLNELRLIKSFLDAAQAKVEYCHELSEGMDLFLYAQKRLQKFLLKQC